MKKVYITEIKVKHSDNDKLTHDSIDNYDIDEVKFLPREGEIIMYHDKIDNLYTTYRVINVVHSMSTNEIIIVVKHENII